MNKVFDYLSRYNRREQSILLVGALAVGLYVLWKALLVPLQDWRSEEVRRNEQALQTLARVKVLSARLQQYRQEADQDASSGGGSITRLVDTSTKDAGLSMSGYQPGTGGEVRVRFDEVPHDRFIQWVHDLEYQYDIRITDLTLAATNEQGKVTANIRMEKN